MITKTEYEKKFPNKVVQYEDLMFLIKKELSANLNLLPHKMDASKVEVLRKIAELNLTHEWVKVQQDAALIKDDEREFTIQRDAVHAGRLVWFGLLERKEPRSGYYKITDLGIRFLKGGYAVPAKIYVSKGEVLDRSPETVTINEIEKVILNKEYWDKYPFNEISLPVPSRTQQGTLF